MLFSLPGLHHKMTDVYSIALAAATAAACNIQLVYTSVNNVYVSQRVHALVTNYKFLAKHTACPMQGVVML